jgi:hypothetical protein
MKSGGQLVKNPALLILPLKGRATWMGRTFGAQDSLQSWRLCLRGSEIIRSPEGAAYPYNSPALQG